MEDIPKGVILVLLIITVLISVLGTWTVLDQISSTHVQYVGEDKPIANARIGIMVNDPLTPTVALDVDSKADIGIKVENPPIGGI